MKDLNKIRLNNLALLGILLSMSNDIDALEFIQNDIRYNTFDEITSFVIHNEYVEQVSIEKRYNLGGTVDAVFFQGEQIKCVTNYDDIGRPLDMNYKCDDSLGVSERIRYKSLGRLESHQLVQGDGTRLYSLDNINYDVNGFLTRYDLETKMADSDSSNENIGVGYRYDDNGQLVAFDFGSQSVEYQYDGQGNMVEHGAIMDMKALPRAKYDDGYHKSGWQYDRLGRLTEDENYRYYYDLSGRVKLIRNRKTHQLVEAYRYDSAGTRISTYSLKNNSVTLVHIAADGSILQQEKHSLEDNSNGNQPEELSQYALFNGKRVLTSNYELHDDGTYLRNQEYAFSDRQGNPVVRWDLETPDSPIYTQYSPYGQQLMDASKHTGPYGFTGVHSDDETGHIYMQARFQSPINGKFLTPDPARDFKSFLPHSYNLYRYTSNNPINSWDPSGLSEDHKDTCSQKHCQSAVATEIRSELEKKGYCAKSVQVGCVPNQEIADKLTVENQGAATKNGAYDGAIGGTTGALIGYGVGSFASGVVAGAAGGSSGGPPGAIAGAVIGGGITYAATSSSDSPLIVKPGDITVNVGGHTRSSGMRTVTSNIRIYDTGRTNVITDTATNHFSHLPPEPTRIRASSQGQTFSNTKSAVNHIVKVSTSNSIGDRHFEH